MKERSNGIATTHLDYHEVLAKDIDAVLIAAPDHWHVRMAVDALAAGKDVYLEKPVTHTIEEGATLAHAVRSGKQILQCGMQQRSWTHFRNAVDLIQGGSLGRVTQVRTYWWQNYQPGRLEAQARSISRPSIGSCGSEVLRISPSAKKSFIAGAGSGTLAAAAMTDLFTHWIDVAHWAMKSDTPREAQMLADKYIFEEWDCPDTHPGRIPLPGLRCSVRGHDELLHRRRRP